MTKQEQINFLVDASFHCQLIGWTIARGKHDPNAELRLLRRAALAVCTITWPKASGGHFGNHPDIQSRRFGPAGSRLPGGAEKSRTMSGPASGNFQGQEARMAR